MMRHLVLADDSTTIQKVIQLSFADENFEIHTFANGPSALEFLRSHGCNIVLADISLPHLDGYDLCREIRQDPRTAGLPVILLAGTFEPFDADRALEVGYTSLLVKPFETGKLVDLVKKLVGRARTGSASSPAVAVRRAEEKYPSVAQKGLDAAKIPIKVPVPEVGGEILFELPPRPQETKTRSVAEPPQLSSDQLEKIVEKVIERLPATLRKLIPDVAREVLGASPGSSNGVLDDRRTESAEL